MRNKLTLIRNCFSSGVQGNGLKQLLWFFWNTDRQLGSIQHFKNGQNFGQRRLINRISFFIKL